MIVTIDGCTRNTTPVSIDGTVYEMFWVSPLEHKSDGIVYKQLNAQCIPVAAHSLPVAIDLGSSCSIWVNGHHYRSGKAINESCTCERCNHVNNNK